MTDGLSGLDLAKMTGCSKVEPIQARPTARRRAVAAPQPKALQMELAAVQFCEGFDRPASARPRRSRPRSVPSTHRQGHTKPRCTEWPARKPIAGADQLHDLDFRAPVQDIEANGIADDDDHTRTEQSAVIKTTLRKMSRMAWSRFTHSVSSCTVRTSGSAVIACSRAFVPAAFRPARPA